MTTFKKTILYTDTDGRAKFREEEVELSEGTPQTMLSPLFPSSGYQLRQSPVGFRSQFHCTTAPQWLFVLSGRMEIGLQDGSSRIFGPGEHFYSDDTLPAGATFDPTVHGHWSQQVGDSPLVTLFVRA
jgi:oxalate decarboxylase/phosphoglucose isomerase-like protein (cupin superfamily)